MSHHLSWFKYGDPAVGFQRAFEERIDKASVYIGTFDTCEEADRAARQRRLEVFTHNDLDRVGS